MQNDMRDRLIELLEQVEGQVNNDIPSLESIADYLIANGVTLPPCKVGNIVWVDDFMWGLVPCKVDRPYHCIFGENGSCTLEMSFTDDDFGKTVFLTKEQAEQKLKETRFTNDL